MKQMEAQHANENQINLVKGLLIGGGFALCAAVAAYQFFQETAPAQDDWRGGIKQWL